MILLCIAAVLDFLFGRAGLSSLLRTAIGSCYVFLAGNIWSMYYPQRIGLLMLAFGFLVQFACYKDLA